MEYAFIKEMVESRNLDKAVLWQIKQALEWQRLTFIESQLMRKRSIKIGVEYDKASKIYNPEHSKNTEWVANLNLKFCQFLSEYDNLEIIHNGFKAFRDIIFHFPNFTQMFLHREGVFEYLKNLLDKPQLLPNNLEQELAAIKMEFERIYQISNVFNRPKRVIQPTICSIFLNKELMQFLGVSEAKLISSINHAKYKVEISETDNEIIAQFDLTCANLPLLKLIFIDVDGYQLSIFELGKKKMNRVLNE